MVNVHVEWDAAKARADLKKHGVSFQEASSVFEGASAKLIDDPDHSELEERFILLGLNTPLKLLVVCHCYRDHDSTVRLISAGKATTTEARFYHS